MKNRALLSAMSLGLAACASAQMPGNTAHDGLCPDTNGKCTVTITATGCDPAKITAVPNRAGIDKNKRNVTITWTIASDGYTFKSDRAGIELKDPADGEFDSPQWVDAKNYKLKDKNSNNKTYGYNIRIFNGGGQECIKDPTIVNGAS